MRKIRLIARLDVKGPNLIKGIHLEGLRVIGSPNVHAIRYYQQGADELIYMDCVASLYGRNSLGDIVQSAAQDVFVPMTVGGGIRSVDDATYLLRSGAERSRSIPPPLRIPGSSAISLGDSAVNAWCFRSRLNTSVPITGRSIPTMGARKPGCDVIRWVKQGVELGAGEILLTSVDREGTRKGFDIPMIRAVTQEVGVPVIASGGMGKPEDVLDAVHKAAPTRWPWPIFCTMAVPLSGTYVAPPWRGGIEVRAYERA